jgi:hypothetical protein
VLDLEFGAVGTSLISGVTCYCVVIWVVGGVESGYSLPDTIRLHVP